jgi:hypothetical protein
MADTLEATDLTHARAVFLPDKPVLAQGRTAPDDTYFDAVVTLVRDERAAGREYSRRQFADRFGGKAQRLGVSMHQLRRVIGEALEQGDLVEEEPSGRARKGLMVLAPRAMVREAI